MGYAGEREFGFRNFMELFSIFSSPPLVSVYNGQSEIGQVHELTFQLKDEGPAVLTLAGRDWMVNHIDWPRRRAMSSRLSLPGDPAGWVPLSPCTWSFARRSRRCLGALNPRSISRSAPKLSCKRLVRIIPGWRRDRPP